MKLDLQIFIKTIVIVALLDVFSVRCWALSSTNIPLDSPVYFYLEKLSGFGLITGDVKGIKPFSRAEVARLLLEAEKNHLSLEARQRKFADELIARIKDIVPREIFLSHEPDVKPPIVDFNIASSLRLCYVYLDAVPRNYERPVHDPGNDGVFGIGSGLRPKNPYPSPAQQRGTEGTPLLENNNGVIYRGGNNGELRWAAEGYLSSIATGLVEPSLLQRGGDTTIRFNRAYLKAGGEGIELEVGKDENWLGQGYRGNITLTNNAQNLTLIKLSSPEPFRVSWLSLLGDLKYTVIGSRFDKTYVNGLERQPWFYALKLISKPTQNLELGFNLGRQQGGPGVENSVGDTIRGLIGGTGSDNSNGLAGFELRYRLAWLRNTEIYGEVSGEDTAGFWPIVESYVAGLNIPRLTSDGRNDFRFEFFQGNQILYTNGTFQEGYLYKNMPVGHSQGGATQDFFSRYSHWFSVRHNLALEYVFTKRGSIGKVNMTNSRAFDVTGTPQAVERKHAARIHWRLPVYGDTDAQITYGYESIKNADLIEGAKRQNHLFVAEFVYRY